MEWKSLDRCALKARRVPSCSSRAMQTHPRSEILTTHRSLESHLSATSLPRRCKLPLPKVQATQAAKSSDLGNSPMSSNVRFGPTADMPALFDHLIGAREQHRWHSQADGFGSFEIDDQLKFRWLFHGDVTGLCAFKYFIHESGRAAIEVRIVHAK